METGITETDIRLGRLQSRKNLTFITEPVGILKSNPKCANYNIDDGSDLDFGSAP